MIVETRTKYHLLFFSFAAILLLSANFAEANCDLCEKLNRARSNTQQQHSGHQSLLKKNQDYLEKLNPSKDASKAIKVKSNILVIILRIETFKNELDTIDNQLKAASCQKCPLTRP